MKQTAAAAFLARPIKFENIVNGFILVWRLRCTETFQLQKEMWIVIMFQANTKPIT